MKWIAHRSGPTKYPEQTVASARLALEIGADMAEIDVRFTSDRRLAVTHDKNLHRVFGEDLECDRITAEKFLSLRHAADVSFGSHLFEDYLRCSVLPLLVHVKEKETVPELLRIIADFGCGDRVTLGVADAESVRLIRQTSPAVRILGFMRSPEDTAAFAAEGADYIRLWEAWLTAENVRAVRESGAELWVMSGGSGTGFPVGEPSVESLWQIARWEPDGILVNNIPFARAVLEEG